MRFCVFDTETEHLNLALSRPWQLSYVLSGGKYIEEEHDYILDIPNFKISDGAAQVTKFSWDKYNRLKEAPIPRLLQFKKIMDDPNVILVAHNGIGFDIYQLRRIFLELGLDWDWDFLQDGRFVDSNCVAKALKENIPFPEKKEDVLAWMFKLNNYHKRGLKTSVGFLLKEYDIEHDEKKLHDGLWDVKYTFEVFKRQRYERQLPV